MGKNSWSRPRIPPGRSLIARPVPVSARGKISRKLPIPATELVRDWSPDGQWLVTSSARHKAGEARRPPTREASYLMHLDGTSIRMVGPAVAKAEDTRGAMLMSPPWFSPDGRFLFWGESTFEPGEGKGVRMTNQRLMMRAVARGTPRELVRLDGRPGYLTSTQSSRDGRSIALHFAGNSPSEDRIEIFDMQGKPARTVSLQSLIESGKRVRSMIGWR